MEATNQNYKVSDLSADVTIHFEENIDDLDFDENPNLIDESLKLTTSFASTSLGKLKQSFSSRVLDWDDNNVIIEMLINKEEGLYQRREFPREMFLSEELLNHGQFLKVFLYLKNRQMSIYFEDGSKVVDPNDFPKLNQFESIKNSNLFKFKKID